jgi:hypothetical protein
MHTDDEDEREQDGSDDLGELAQRQYADPKLRLRPARRSTHAAAASAVRRQRPDRSCPAMCHSGTGAGITQIA